MKKLSNFQKRKLGLKKSWVSYKGKTVTLNFEPRKGICSICEKEDEHTILHHEQYDDNDPLAHTIEVCVKCHGMEHALTFISTRLGKKLV